MDQSMCGSLVRLPLLTSLSAVAEFEKHGCELFVRYSEGHELHDGSPSIDYESGLELPGISANPLGPAPWWSRPVLDWTARQLCQYVQLKHDEPIRQAWILTGEIVGQGPDCEPLIAHPEALAVVHPCVLEEAQQVYRQRFDAGRGPTG